MILEENRSENLLLHRLVLPLGHTCDISLFLRDLPHDFGGNLSIWSLRFSLYILYISYFEFQISLSKIKNFLLCL